MEYNIVQRAVQHETTRAKRLVPRSNIKVNVFLHNVAPGPTWDEGYVSESLPQDQFNIIPKRFLLYRITMSLSDINHTINPLWANNTVFSQSKADMEKRTAPQHLH
ncbi:uncharacterized protein M421DRAFT_3728 [Didymella exigua CBS 183.55]|uniref:Uncharacterized protein n=1 Tax=Didymella exigua CBS 183.55 TaxID=1150837 RepID=A0A6A5RXH5_9PLEO|nr:uncharacterized protein M421DRAFT_3728 [Didymella exigua CBS 183.55]KAF1929957.1 hypothetical protein M421DRAFT_3728 [Didymella exigua CBS 183.55]